MSAEALQALPPVAWACVFLLLALLGAALVFAYRLLLKRNVRLKGLEISERRERQEDKRELREEIRENARHEQSDIISSQYSTALNLLQKMRIDIYEAGVRSLGIKEHDKRNILLDIAWIIETRVAREVLLDLVRNHITGKGKAELARYADAKADGYWRRAKTDLFSFAAQLPEYSLPDIMDHVPVSEFRKLFEDVYSAACNIAGGKHKEEEKE